MAIWKRVYVVKVGFISEIHYVSNLSVTEFLEITLKTSEDPSNYTVSFLDQNGAIYESSRADGAVNGLLNLGHSSVYSVPHPTNSSYTIYTIFPTSGGLFTGANARNGESRAVALTNEATGETLDAYAINANGLTVTEGPATGTPIINAGSAGSSTSIQIDSDGNRTAAAYTQDNSVVACFAAGTLIETSKGARAVETLNKGDSVLTRDRGFQRLHHVAHSVSDPKHAPILFDTGSLGCDVPETPMMVSPQHRMLIRSKIARRMFGTKEVLIASKHLTEVEGVEEMPKREPVTYVHLFCGSHEVILAHGCWSESLYPGPMAIQALTVADQRKLNLIAQNSDPVTPARPLIGGRQARNLVERHIKNNMPLFSEANLAPSKSAYLA